MIIKYFPKLSFFSTIIVFFFFFKKYLKFKIITNERFNYITKPNMKIKRPLFTHVTNSSATVFFPLVIWIIDSTTFSSAKATASSMNHTIYVKSTYSSFINHIVFLYSPWFCSSWPISFIPSSGEQSNPDHLFTLLTSCRVWIKFSTIRRGKLHFISKLS